MIGRGGKLHIGIPRWGTHSLTLAAFATVAIAASLVWNIQSIRTDVEDMVAVQSQGAFDQTSQPLRPNPGHDGVGTATGDGAVTKQLALTNMVFEKALGQYDRRARAVYFAHAALLLAGLTAVGLGALRHHSNEQRRRAAEGEVELSHSLLRAALESTADGILVVGLDGRVKMSNSRFLEMWGIPEGMDRSTDDEIVLSQVVSQLADPDQFLSKVRELYSQPELTSFDLVEFKDGRVYERYSQPQRIGETIHGRVWSFRNVTERKQIETELLKSIDAANAANRAKSNFLANISHEIRTPMNGVLGMTNLALQTDMDTEQRDYLETVRTSAESLLSLLDQVLDLSEMQAGRLSLETKCFSLRSTVSHAVETVAPQATAKRLELNCSIREEVADSLVGDPLRLRQVLINILGNAIKFTHEGSVSLNVDLEQTNADRAVLRVSVSDTGIGIPKEQQEVIFQPFVQADDSSTRNYGGTGLGLAISRQLVELMGGRLTMTSEKGKGATFTFTARVGLRSEGRATAPSIVAGARRASDESSLRVLLVDDNPVNRRVTESILGKHGHEVITVGDGRGALEALAARDIDVVLVDVQTPGMDGDELAAAILASAGRDGGCLPIIALDAPIVDDRSRGLKSGIDRYVSKPIRADELLDAIREAVTAKRQSSIGKDKAA